MMAFKRRKKNSRQRGSTTHGCGSMKKRRGAGNRGGRGRAGTGKRGDQRKPCFWGGKPYFGKSGFVSKSRAPKIHAINIKTVEDVLPSWERKSLVEKKGDSYVIDLGRLGYNKLLGTGKCTKKLVITVDFASPGAVEKVKAAGGDVKVNVKSGGSEPGSESEEVEQAGSDDSAD